MKKQTLTDSSAFRFHCWKLDRVIIGFINGWRYDESLRFHDGPIDCCLVGPIGQRRRGLYYPWDYGQLMRQLMFGGFFNLSAAAVRRFRKTMEKDYRYIVPLYLPTAGGIVRPAYMLAQDPVKAMRMEINNAIIGHWHPDARDKAPKGIHVPVPDGLLHRGPSGDRPKDVPLSYWEYLQHAAANVVFHPDEIAAHRFFAVASRDAYCRSLEPKAFENAFRLPLDLSEERGVVLPC